jgi:hypothetical protein
MIKYVLAVDPGKATGVVFMSWNGSDPVPNVILSKEVQPEEFALVIDTILNTLSMKKTSPLSVSDLLSMLRQSVTLRPHTPLSRLVSSSTYAAPICMTQIRSFYSLQQTPRICSQIQS